MSRNTLMLVFFLSCAFVGCNQITDSAPDPSVQEPETPIVQLADTLKVRQGERAEISLTDFFQSEAPIVYSELVSEEQQITVDAIGDGRYRLTHPEDLAGEFRILATLTNGDNSTLETKLFYLIEQDPADPDPTPTPTPDPTPNPNPSGDELVIMPLGDSMTNDSRSRVTLWNLLTADGHKLDYVGNQHQGSSIPDPDHEGVGGIKIEGIMEKAESLMQNHKPEYVALMVGTNDIAWYFDESAAEIAARWNDLIDLIFDSSEPGTVILAATIPPVSSSNVGKSGMDTRDRAVMVERYNAELRSIIEARRESGDPIYLADMEVALDPSRHLSGDGVHLNSEGYATMGEVYYEAMNRALQE